MAADNNDVLKQVLAELKELRKGQEKIDKDLTKLAVHVEGELTDKIRGLYDARSVTLDSLERIEENQNRQDQRLDLQSDEILILKTKRRR